MGIPRTQEDYRTMSLKPHSAKILLRILNRKLYGGLNAEIKKEQFGFQRGKGTSKTLLVCYEQQERNT